MRAGRPDLVAGSWVEAQPEEPILASHRHPSLLRTSIRTASLLVAATGLGIILPAAASQATTLHQQHLAHLAHTAGHPAIHLTAAAGSSSFQACVIARESGGNPHAVNPYSGAGGLFQFLPSSWAALGYSGLPQNAPVAEQYQAFARLYAQQGRQPWSSDGC